MSHTDARYRFEEISPVTQLSEIPNSFPFGARIKYFKYISYISFVYALKS